MEAVVKEKATMNKEWGIDHSVEKKTRRALFKLEDYKDDIIERPFSEPNS